MSGICGPKRSLIIKCQLCHWFRADAQLGEGIAEGLGVNIDEVMQMMHAKEAATA